MKIRHGAIVDNVVTYVYANLRSLVTPGREIKSDIVLVTTGKRTTYAALGDPCPGLIIYTVVTNSKSSAESGVFM